MLFRSRLPLPSSAPLVGAAGAEGGRCGGTLTPSPSPALRAALTPGPSPALRAALTPSPAPARRAARTPSPAPVLRAALTPSPAPALRERGELVGGLDIVDRHRRSVATATLTLPLPLAVEERKKARGKVRGQHPPFLSPWRSGRGPEGRSGAASPPSARRGGAEEGQREGAGGASPLPLPQCGRGRGPRGR